MIRYQFFPRSRGVTKEIQDVIDCFKAVEGDIDSNLKNLVSNDVLSIVRPHLEKHSYKVEMGKSTEEKIDVPVLFGQDNQINKLFSAFNASSCPKRSRTLPALTKVLSTLVMGARR